MSQGYKLAWRMTVDLIDTPEKCRMMDDLLVKTGVADEFNVFIAEPSSHGYFPLDKMKIKCDAFAKAAEYFHGRGIRIGIDQWPSFGAEESYQNAAGEPALPFQGMMGVDGSVARRVACPISPEFLAYTKEKFRLFAATGADFIWIDDDCRFTHLGGVKYPCFCENCVKGFENGRFADRETLVAALNAPENGQLRRAWSAWGAKRLAMYCQAAREAVDEVNPACDVPFMTVGYSHTTFSGDYIEQCMRAAKSHAGRPGHGFYWDDKPLEAFEKVTEMARQVLRYSKDARGDVQYEEESCPCTPLNKAMYTRLVEAALSIWGGCNGMAFNHLSANGAVGGADSCACSRPMGYYEDEVALLQKNRSFLNQYADLAAKLPMQGLWVADNEFMMAGMRVDEKGWFNEYNKEYAIQNVEAEWPQSGVSLSVDPVHAWGSILQGRVVDTYSDDQIKALFQKPVFLDALALQALQERGLGHLTGVRLGEGHHGLSEVLTDHALNGEFAESSRNAIFKPVYSLLPLADDVEVLAVGQDAYGKSFGPCMTRWHNAVVTGSDPYRFLGTVGKCHQLRELQKEMGAPAVFQPEDDYRLRRVSSWVRGNEKQAAVLLINGALDVSVPSELVLKGEMKTARMITPDGEKNLRCRCENGVTTVSVPELAAWGMAVIDVK